MNYLVGEEGEQVDCEGEQENSKEDGEEEEVEEDGGQDDEKRVPAKSMATRSSQPVAKRSVYCESGAGCFLMLLPRLCSSNH